MTDIVKVDSINLVEYRTSNHIIHRYSKAVNEFYE